MTSKSLFFKLIRQDWKQRLWCFVLAMTVFFFVLPVSGAVVVSGAEWRTAEQTSEAIMSYVSEGSVLLLAVTLTGAVICGVSGFAFLQSRKKVDFYHSLPVRRETLFAVFYLDGVLLYLVPYLINLLLFLVITAGRCQDPGLLLHDAFAYLGMHLAYYLLIYTVAVLAVMLTGNLLASLLGFCCLSFYGAAVQAVNWMYHRYFYETFWSDKAEIYFHASPVISYGFSLSELSEALDGGSGQLWGRIGWVLLAAAVILAVSLLLYRLRPSESAEKAVAFPLSKPVLYVLLSVPSVLSGTMFFITLTAGYETLWMIFGLIFSWLIVHGFLQIIMESEFKAIFRGRIHMGAAGAVSAVILAVFVFDLTGYDSYRPTEDRFASAAVAFGNLNENIYEWTDVGEVSAYENHVDVAMKRMAYTDYQTLEELLDLTVSNRAGETAEAESFPDSADLSMKEREAAETAEGSDSEGAEGTVRTGTVLYVKFSLKNRKEVYRSYWLQEGTDLEVIDRIFSTAEFKEGSYPLLTMTEEEAQGAYFDNGVEIVDVGLDHAGLARLLRTVQKEYRELTLYNIEEIPYGQLNFLKTRQEEGMPYYPEDDQPYYYIYPSMTETIALLEEAGLEGWPLSGLNAGYEGVVDGSDLYYYAVDRSGMEAVEQSGLEEDYITTQYQRVYSGEQLRELLPAAVPGDWLWANDMVLTAESWLHMDLMIGGMPEEEETSVYCRFPEGRVPDFVREDLRYDVYLQLVN